MTPERIAEIRALVLLDEWDAPQTPELLDLLDTAERAERYAELAMRLAVECHHRDCSRWGSLALFAECLTPRCVADAMDARRYALMGMDKLIRGVPKRMAFSGVDF